jgi:hypothetical protein
MVAHFPADKGLQEVEARSLEETQRASIDRGHRGAEKLWCEQVSTPSARIFSRKLYDSPRPVKSGCNPNPTCPAPAVRSSPPGTSGIFAKATEANQPPGLVVRGVVVIVRAQQRGDIALQFVGVLLLERRPCQGNASTTRCALQFP